MLIIDSMMDVDIEKIKWKTLIRNKNQLINQTIH